MNTLPRSVVASRPSPDAGGIPQHGARWGDGVVLRARSRGPGVAVEVRNPRGAYPRRLVTGAATLSVRGGKIYLTPSVAAAGEDFWGAAEW